MKTLIKEPLYKKLNKERTQGEWDCGYGDSSMAFGIFTKKMLEEELCESPICLISPKDKMNDTDIANGEYIKIAVNNLHRLAEALNELIKKATETTKDIGGFDGADILDAAIDKAKEALIKIS